ncbi:type II secretion system protein J [Diaminobutyricimonas sp. LJ205]|uniref:PulJ/GspJ family protein n=1 Tax=Diaminobutyricimonas sp. LJ205 TaxID=2683590 RepID=UPI0012F4FDF7|nr:prepilin-type N-terminal cleavage/methylation domain-containing protein [Diaminobutyricimonas sp. LJ205]
MTRNSSRQEGGFTLIELLVYMLLSAVVLMLAGGLLINSILTQRTISDSAESTNTGQLIAQAMSAAVRDASAVRVVSGDPAILLVQVVDDARATPPAAHCEAWALNSGDMRMVRYSGATGAPVSDAAVASWLTTAVGGFNTWTKLATDASAHDGGSGPIPVFQANGSTGVDLTLDVATGRGVTALIETTAVSRQPSLTGVSPTCF